MSRFTLKGWLMLPIALALRIPLALMEYGFYYIHRATLHASHLCHDIKNKMPSSEYNDEWVKRENARSREEALSRYISFERFEDK